MNGKTARPAPATEPAPAARSAELVHRLAEAGRQARSSRSDADGTMLAWLRPVLAEALASGEPTPLGDTGWWLPSPDPAADPHVRLTVTKA